jgi:hypothetical protein
MSGFSEPDDAVRLKGGCGCGGEVGGNKTIGNFCLKKEDSADPAFTL